VQGTGDVGGRDNDAVTRLDPVRLGTEEALFFPILVPLFFDPLGIIDFFQISVMWSL
jgi:hypothetical protein